MPHEIDARAALRRSRPLQLEAFVHAPELDQVHPEKRREVRIPRLSLEQPAHLFFSFRPEIEPRVSRMPPDPELQIRRLELDRDAVILQ